MAEVQKNQDAVDSSLLESKIGAVAGLITGTSAHRHIAAWQLDPASGEMIWSDEMYQLLELNPQPASLSLIATHIDYPNPQATEKMLWDELIKAPVEKILSLRLSSGFKKQVKLTSAPLLLANGTTIISGTMNDISMAGGIEVELTASQHNLRNILNSAIDPIVAIDTQFRIILFNKAYASNFKAIFGFKPSEKQNLPDLIGKNEEQRTNAIALWTRALSGEEFIVEREFTDLKGHKRYYETRFAPLRNDAGGIIGACHIARDVTEKREADQLINRILELSNQGIVTVKSLQDEKGAITDFIYTTVNQAALKMLNKKSSDLIGKRVFDIYRGAKDEGFFEAYKRVLNTGKNESHTFYYPHEGVNKWFYQTFAKFDDGLVITTSDITELKTYEEEVKEQSRKLDEIQQMAYIGNYEWDPRTLKVTWSDNMYNIYGVSKSFNPSEDFINLVHEEDREYFHHIYDQLFVSGYVDYRFRFYKGTEVNTISGKALCIRDESSNLVKVSGYAQDITERVQIEEKLLNNEKMLNDAQQLGKVGSYEWNLMTREIKWSPEHYRIFELSPSIPLTYDVISHNIHPEDMEKVKEARIESIENGKPFDVEFRLLLSGNRVKHIWSKAKVSYSENGKPVRLLGTVQDITERKMTEQMLIDQNRELKRSNSELEQFAYVASHDMKEPLRMISSYTQLLANRYLDLLDDQGKEYVKYATEGANRMSNLINDLLQFSRIGRAEVLFKDFDLNMALESAQKNLSHLLDTSKLTITAGKLPTLKVVPSYMTLLFQNLIENALKFHGEKEPSIRVTAEKKKKEWLLCVADNGIGMASEYLERIFIIFQRLHTREQYPGTGIGLAICRKIVEFHKGKIWAESEPGKGSKFYFTLPVS